MRVNTRTVVLVVLTVVGMCACPQTAVDDVGGGRIHVTASWGGVA